MNSFVGRMRRIISASAKKSSNVRPRNCCRKGFISILPWMSTAAGYFAECIAQKDYDVAKHLYDIFRPMPLEIICYQSQQAGEKALKALYVFLGVPGGVPKNT